MPLAYNSIANFADTDGSATSASFTPSNNSLLVVIGSRNYFTGATPDLSISDSLGLTWTRQITFGRGSAPFHEIGIWTTPITTGASMTVTLTAAAGGFAVNGIIGDCTGHNTTTPVVNATNGFSIAASTDPQNFSLGAAPASSSLVLAAIAGSDWVSMTEGSGWTEITEIDTGSTELQAQRRAGSTSTTVEWADIETFGPSISAAIEIQEAAAGGSIAPLIHSHRQRRAA